MQQSDVTKRLSLLALSQANQSSCADDFTSVLTRTPVYASCDHRAAKRVTKLRSKSLADQEVSLFHLLVHSVQMPMSPDMTRARENFEMAFFCFSVSCSFSTPSACVVLGGSKF